MPIRSISMADDVPQQHQQHHHHHGHSHRHGGSSSGSGGGGAQEACYMASKRLLALAGVKVRQHQLSHSIVLCG